MSRKDHKGGHVNLDQFKIGQSFCVMTKDGPVSWRCTDVGTRTIAAVCLADHPDDPSWYNGPPYAVVEHVFDEDDVLACIVQMPTTKDT